MRDPVQNRWNGCNRRNVCHHQVYQGRGTVVYYDLSSRFHVPFMQTPRAFFAYHVWMMDGWVLRNPEPAPPILTPIPYQHAPFGFLCWSRECSLFSIGICICRYLVCMLVCSTRSRLSRSYHQATLMAYVGR